MKKVRTAAEQALKVLDGGVLAGLSAFAGEKLRIDSVRKVADKASIDNLEPWLKAKRADFLGRELDLSGLREIQKILHLLDSKAAELYKASLEALARNWKARAVLSYSSATTKRALLDVTFDFAANPGLGDSLTNVIHGNWNSVLPGKPAGVKIRQSVLTHGVKCQTHLELNLPYRNRAIAHLNESTAAMNFVSDEGGICLYELAADDSLTQQRRWQSVVSLSGKIAAKAGSGIRVFPGEDELANAFTYSYTLRLARNALRVPQMEQQSAPIMSRYFPIAFCERHRVDAVDAVGDRYPLQFEIRNFVPLHCQLLLLCDEAVFLDAYDHFTRYRGQDAGPYHHDPVVAVTVPNVADVPLTRVPSWLEFFGYGN